MYAQNWHECHIKFGPVMMHLNCLESTFFENENLTHKFGAHKFFVDFL